MVTYKFSGMIKVLVIGATGLLGATLVPYLRSEGHYVLSSGLSTSSDFNVDLTDGDETFKLLDLIRPDIVVNLVAYTDVDGCEQFPEKANLINVKTVSNLCSSINRISSAIHLIHISTDMVYSGVGPHTEILVNPINQYSQSKLLSEEIALGVSSTIIRTNFFGKSNAVKRVSFTDWLYFSLINKQPINVFNDVLFSPLSLKTLSKLIGYFVRNRVVGVFNLGSHDGMSKAEFSLNFAQSLGLSTDYMKSITMDKSLFRAERPKDMRLNCDYFENISSLNLPSLKDEIAQSGKDYCV